MTAPTATGPTTVDRILDGALKGLAMRGSKLSMSDICEQAGVSRGTLYRYFRNKDEVLQAIGRHVESGARDNLAEAIAAQPDAEERLRVVLDVVAHYRFIHPEAMLVIDLEPGFAIPFVRGVFPRFIDFVAAALEPAVPHIPAVRDGALTVHEFAELALRVGASTYFIPDVNVDEVSSWLTKLASYGSAA